MIISTLFCIYFVVKQYIPYFKKTDKKLEASKMDEKKIQDICDVNYNQKKPTLRFFPPVFLQRYIAVREFIKKPEFSGKIKKVVDFGCDKLAMFKHLKEIPGIEELLFVDVNKEILQMHKNKVDPLPCDYLHMRDRPLKVSILNGSLIDPDERLKNVDVIVCIEVIEHLDNDILEKVPEAFFGVIKPSLAILTTPNSDFNVLFSNMTGLRHPDHRFEWSRKEFKEWCNNVIQKYPDYKVKVSGVGKGPRDKKNLGCVSQIAYFTRKDMTNDKDYDDELFKEYYELIHEEDYPFHVDTRTLEDKVNADAMYYMNKFRFYNEDGVMPIKSLNNLLHNYNLSEEHLIDILKNKCQCEITEIDEGKAAVICPEPEPFISSSDELNDDDIDGTVREIVNDDEAQAEYWSEEDSKQSICSHYLEASKIDNSLVCPINITNPEFQISKSANIDDSDVNFDVDFKDDDKRVKDVPIFTSTPSKKRRFEKIYDSDEFAN